MTRPLPGLQYTCTKCGKVATEDLFVTKTRCKECRRQYMHSWYLKTYVPRERTISTVGTRSCIRCGKTRRPTSFVSKTNICKACVAKYQHEWYVKTYKHRRKPPSPYKTCYMCKRSFPRTEEFFCFSGGYFVSRCRACSTIHTTAWHQKLRTEALVHYSSDPPYCTCPGCNEHHLEFLSIDHINNDGAAHRKVLRGASLYSWLKKHSYPEGFRVLCFNCNMARGFYGYCPHDKKTTISVVHTGRPRVKSRHNFEVQKVVGGENG